MRIGKKLGTGALAFAVLFTGVAGLLPADVFAAPDSFTGQLSSVTDATVDSNKKNVVHVQFNDGEVAAKITFLEDGIFRYNVDPSGEFSE